MKVLIINNGQNPPSNFLRLFAAHECDVVAADIITPVYPTVGYDLIILTGSNSHPILYNYERLDPLLVWTRTLTIPTIGICYGAGLIASAFAADHPLTDGEEKFRGIAEVTPVPETGWTFSQERYLVYEAHRWNITNLPPVFKPLITNERGVLLFEHHSRPLVGFQFHPEKHPDETDGWLLLTACLDHLNVGLMVETKVKQ